MLSTEPRWLIATSEGYPPAYSQPFHRSPPVTRGIPLIGLAVRNRLVLPATSGNPGLPSRRRGGSREPHRAIMRSTTGIWSAKWCGGSAARPSGSSWPRRSPGRSVPISRSARRKATGTGSPTWSRRRRCRSTWPLSTRTARPSRRSYMMNKMGTGIIGSDRSTEYGQAIYDAVTS